MRTAAVLSEAKTSNRYTDVAERPLSKPDEIYRGILILPLQDGGVGRLGVLQVERETSERFDPYQVTLCRALAALFAAGCTP